MKFALIGAQLRRNDGFRNTRPGASRCLGPRLLRAVLPDAKFHNLGSGNPYTDGGYYRGNNWQNSNAMMPRHVHLHAHVEYHPR